LGSGHFSSVWLAFNIKDKNLYALKVMRSHERYARTGQAEENMNKLVAENYNDPFWIKNLRHVLREPDL
jgi:serine/threonine protein kinase